MIANTFGWTRPGADRSGVAMFAAGVGAAAIAAYLLLHGSLTVAVAFCAVPLIVWLLARPSAMIGLLGASIPLMYDITGGRGGFHLAPSDIVLVLAAAGVLLAAARAGTAPAVHVLGAVKRPAAQYGVFLVVLLVLHFSFKDVAQVGQRFELFLVPLLVGAFAGLVGKHLALLKAYVVAASGLALLWPLHHNLGQKNPVGQIIGNAILLLLGVKSLRRYAPFALVLVPGLFLSASRGAVVATIIGVVVILAYQESHRAAFGRVAAVGIVALVAYALLPVSLQNRLTTFTPGKTSTAAYSLHIRQEYVSDAERLIAKHPLVGIGVGNYFAGDPQKLTAATDPHNVLLLQAAEGGYGFAASFVILIAGVAFVLRRMVGVETAAAAAGVLLATVAHGLVDVYWVRGTPLLGWLLVGTACALYAQQKTHRSEAQT